MLSLQEEDIMVCDLNIHVNQILYFLFKKCILFYYSYEDDEKEKLKLRNCEQNLKDAKKIFESVRAKTELIKEVRK